MTGNDIGARIKPGDNMRMRCGGILKPDRVEIRGNARTAMELWFADVCCIWLSNGHWLTTGLDHPLDIVEILPHPLTEAERLAKIAELATTATITPDILAKIHTLAAPARLDPGRQVMEMEWYNHSGSSKRSVDIAIEIVRNRLAEAEALRHEQ